MGTLGDACHDTRSTTRSGVDGKGTVQQRHPFAHREDPESVPVAEGRVTLVEAVTVVLDDEGGSRAGLGDPDDRRLRSRVLADVGQGLLDDPG